MAKEIAVVHNDIKITYNENTNKWKFELRGRERSENSLTDAKAAIDKPAPKKQKPFTRIKAWHISYSTITPCEVTSIAEPTRRGDQQVWIVMESANRFKDKGERSKESACEIVPSNEKNDAAVKAILEKRAEAARINAIAEELEEKLPRLKINDEPEE